MDEISTYVLVDPAGTQVSAEFDTAREAASCREIVGLVDAVADPSTFRVVRKVYTFTGRYENAEPAQDDLWTRVERYFAGQVHRMGLDPAATATFGPVLSPPVADLITRIGPTVADSPDGLRVLAALLHAYAMAAEEEARRPDRSG